MSGRKPNVACLICGTLVYRRPSLLEESQGRAFCSQTCYGIFCRKEVPCVTCGTPILSGKNTKTCSKPCFEAFSKTIDRSFSIGSQALVCSLDWHSHLQETSARRAWWRLRSVWLRQGKELGHTSHSRTQ